jgi:FKBP-type peptidyl-prolyl cis-trans isomerase FkpA
MAMMAVTACSSDGTVISPRTTPTAATLNVPFSATDTVVGTGATATSTHMVLVNYTGWLYDPDATDHKGKKFDSNTNFGFLLGIGNVIKGWDQGIPGMRVGGTRILVIPPDLAYGAAGAGSAIPGNSTLLFEVTLVGAS